MVDAPEDEERQWQREAGDRSEDRRDPPLPSHPDHGDRQQHVQRHHHPGGNVAVETGAEQQAGDEQQPNVSALKKGHEAQQPRKGERNRADVVGCHPAHDEVGWRQGQESRGKRRLPHLREQSAREHEDEHHVEYADEGGRQPDRPLRQRRDLERQRDEIEEHRLKPHIGAVVANERIRHRQEQRQALPIQIASA